MGAYVEQCVKGMTVGLLELLEEHTDPGTVEVAIVSEGAVDLEGLGNFATHFGGDVFGFLWTLIMKYRI